MVKVIVHMYPMMRADSPEERKELRPIGRNKERFQEAMDGMPDIIRAFEDMGVWVCRPSSITSTPKAMRSARRLA